MRWLQQSPGSEPAYEEIAPTLDYAEFQRNLDRTASVMNWGLAIGLGVLFGLFAATFLLSLSGDSSFLVILLAAGIPIAIISGTTFWVSTSVSKLSGLYTAVVHEEWKTGKAILPEGFRAPWMCRKLREIPDLSPRLLRRLKLAELAFSVKFVAIAGSSMMGALVVGEYLAFNGAPGWALAAVVLAPALPIIAFLLAMGSSYSLLQELREYERVTGRVVLPRALAEERHEVN